MGLARALVGASRSALIEWPDQEAPPRGLLEQVVADVFATIILTRHRVNLRTDEDRWRDEWTMH